MVGRGSRSRWSKRRTTERWGSTRPFACYRLDVAPGSHDQIEDRSEFDDRGWESVSLTPSSAEIRLRTRAAIRSRYSSGVSGDSPS